MGTHEMSEKQILKRPFRMKFYVWLLWTVVLFIHLRRVFNACWPVSQIMAVKVSLK